MKSVKKTSRGSVKCAERDRLWAAFLKVGKEWESMQARMRKALKAGRAFEPDLTKVEDVRNRIEATHRSFSKHIENHGCWQPKVSLLKRKKRNSRIKKW